MATLDDIVARGVLRPYEADLRAGEQVERLLYVTPSLEAWCDTYLWAAPKDRGRNLTPYEQTDSMFTHFVAGRPMAYGNQLRKLEPIGFDVWEMRPTDVRIFGYFYIKRVFIAVCGELKKNLTSNPMYKPFINQVKHVIDTTDLDPPKVLRARLRIRSTRFAGLRNDVLLAVRNREKERKSPVEIAERDPSLILKSGFKSHSQTDSQ